MPPSHTYSRLSTSGQGVDLDGSSDPSPFGAFGVFSRISNWWQGLEPSTRNAIVSHLAGVIFAVAWWILIDAHVVSVKWERELREGCRPPADGSADLFGLAPGVRELVAWMWPGKSSADALAAAASSASSSSGSLPECPPHVSGAMWWWFYFPALLSTLSLIMVNAVSSQVLSGDTFDLDDGTLLFARVWIFVALFLSFAGLFGSAWIMIQRYFVPNKDGLLPLHKWPGVSLLVNTFLIFLSSMLMRFGRARRGSF